MRDTTDFKDRFQRWKDGTPINELYDCGKALKKCDTGLSTEDEDNPWIPKGTKVATQNSEPVSAKPKTTIVSVPTPTVLDVQDEQTKQQNAIMAGMRHINNVSQQEPVSGTDPVGELWVAGRALTPIFKGLGWLGKTVYNAALPTLGRITKPYTNYFAAQALSNSIDNAVSTPTFSKILPTAEYVWKDIDLPRHLKIGDAGGPFNEEVLRINGAFDAIDAFEHPARKQLIDKLSKEAGFPLQVPNGLGTFPSNMLKLTETDADKFLGKNVNGLRDGYNILFREKADPTTPFHELLHLQGFGTVDWDYTKLQTLLDDYLAKGINVSKLESSGAPFMQIRDAKREYYAAEQAYKQLFGLKEDTERFLEQKVKSVLKDDAEEYISRPNEFVIHGLQAGRKVGLKPYQPEPTYDPYNTGVPIVDFGKIMETVQQAVKKHNWFGELKLDTPEDYHNAWKVLTGNFLPAAVITGSTFGALQEHDKGKSIHINPANRGKFNATKKRTGKTTEQLAHSKNPLTRKRAVFALNSRKWSK